MRVCQEMFLNTLCISDTVVRTACAKQGPGGNIVKDMRGSVSVKKKIPVEVLQSVHDHLASLPKVASHYCRQNTSYVYLEEKVDSVSNLYSLYKDWMNENHSDKPMASKRQYEDEYSSLKISIFKPRKDLCDICFSYDNLSDRDKAEQLQAQEQHILAKDLAEGLKKQERLDSCKNYQSVATCAFDLQKVLLLPHCSAGPVFYKRKLNVYNFTIYNMGLHEGHCYVWHESIAGKGANEIASHVYDYLCKTSASGEIKLFKFWSDNCASQNKNRMLFGMYVVAAVKLNVRIEHKFLIKGHTMNEADAMHSLIERKTQKNKVYLPGEWCTLMREAKVTGKPYTVNEVKQADIFDFHEFVDKHSSWKKDDNKDAVVWTEVSEVAADPKNPWVLEVKYHLGDQPIRVNLRKKGRSLNLKDYEHPPAYDHSLPITVKKAKDLQTLCDTNIIPQYAQGFYRALISGENVQDEHYNA